MSDSESIAQAHAMTGGKSLAAAERPRYKSWRKKYRKMRHRFDGVLEENKRLFKDEQKLEGIAKRLREELDGIMELLLDLNQTPALPTHMRFDVSLPETHTAVASIPSVVDPNVTPHEANDLLQQYTTAVQKGQIPHLDLHVIRDQLDKGLAKQGVSSIDTLESSISHPTPKPDIDHLPDHLRGPNPPGFLTSEEEEAYLLRVDAKLGDPLSLDKTALKEREGIAPEKHWADLTPREVERQVELLNRQSQHNWLKVHAKQNGGEDVDDTESLASHSIKPATGRKGKRDLAKQVGDRAVGRAREGFSPGATSAGYGEDDELSFVDENPQSGTSRKRGRGDVDGTYRVKGGKSTAAKGKRKRTDDQPTNATPVNSAAKKPRLDD